MLFLSLWSVQQSDPASTIWLFVLIFRVYHYVCRRYNTVYFWILIMSPPTEIVFHIKYLPWNMDMFFHAKGYVWLISFWICVVNLPIFFWVTSHLIAPVAVKQCWGIWVKQIGGSFPVLRCCLSSIEIPIIKIRWSHNPLIVLMEIPMYENNGLCIEMGPCALIQYKDAILPI